MRHQVGEVVEHHLIYLQNIEEIKKKLQSQDKNIELVFNYLDELIDKQESPKPRKQIGFKQPKK